MTFLLYAVVIVLLLAALIPLSNAAYILWTGNHLFSILGTTLDMTSLGQMGDFFGGHTAAFSGLLSAALIVHFSLQQLKIAKQTADLTSIAKIYDHYGEAYGGSQDKNEILSRVARGHRRWAIRESFSIADPDNALENERKKQVKKDFDSLVEICGGKLVPPDQIRRFDYCQIAELCGSLLLDKRLAKKKRVALWMLYELIRSKARDLEDIDSPGSKEVAEAARVLHKKFSVKYSYSIAPEVP
jgi:hypothetical protein